MEPYRHHKTPPPQSSSSSRSSRPRTISTPTNSFSNQSSSISTQKATSKVGDDDGTFETPSNQRGTPTKSRPVTPGTNRPVTPGTILPLTPGTNRPLTPGTNRSVTPGTNRPLTPGTNRSVTPGTNRSVTPISLRHMHQTTIVQSPTGSAQQNRPISIPKPLSARPIPGLIPIPSPQGTFLPTIPFFTAISGDATAVAANVGLARSPIIYGKKSAPTKRPITSSPEEENSSDKSIPSAVGATKKTTVRKRIDTRSSLGRSGQSKPSFNDDGSNDGGCATANKSTNKIIQFCDPEEAWKTLLAFRAKTKERRVFNHIARHEHFLTGSRLGAAESNEQIKQFILCEMAWTLDGVVKKFTKQESLEAMEIGKFKYDAAFDVEVVILQFLKQIRKRFNSHYKYLNTKFESKQFQMEESLQWSEDEKEKAMKKKAFKHKTYLLKN